MSGQPEGNYYIRSRGRVTGPFTTEQLRSLRTRGQFGRLHEISEDRQTWKSAVVLDALFATTTSREKSRAVDQNTPEDLAEQYLPAFQPQGLVPVSDSGGPGLKAVWHYALGNQPYGPVTLLEIRNLIELGQLTSKDLVFREGLDDWQPISKISELKDAASPKSRRTVQQPTGQSWFCFACGEPVDPRAEVCPDCGVRQSHRGQHSDRNRLTAALLAAFLGGLGAHHFYLGNTLLGVIYLLFFWTLIPHIVALVECIVFLTMSDARFQEKYGAA